MSGCRAGIPKGVCGADTGEGKGGGGGCCQVSLKEVVVAIVTF